MNSKGQKLSELQKEVLAALCDKELYPVQIINTINELRRTKGGFWWLDQVSLARIYPAINSLEKRGLVTSRFEDSPNLEVARRKTYTATELGKDILESIATS